MPFNNLGFSTAHELLFIKLTHVGHPGTVAVSRLNTALKKKEAVRGVYSAGRENWNQKTLEVFFSFLNNNY